MESLRSLERLAGLERPPGLERQLVLERLCGSRHHRVLPEEVGGSSRVLAVPVSRRCVGSPLGRRPKMVPKVFVDRESSRGVFIAGQKEMCGAVA